MKSIFEEMGDTYREIDGFQIPNLIIAETAPIGKWGRMRKRFLKEHRPVLYSSLLLSGKLYEHLAGIDHTAGEQIDTITTRLAASRGINEKIKAEHQLRWVREMNNIRAAAEESILEDLIFA